MKIWELTQLGSRLARSTSHPDTEPWRIVHFLDSVGRSTTDQIITGARAPSAGGTLAILKARQVVRESGSSAESFE